MQIRPISDYILIKRNDPEEVTPGGLYVPPAAQTASCFAQVVEVGPGRTSQEGQLLPMTVQPGQVVLLSRWGGTEIEIDGEKLYLIREGEVLGIVEE